MKLKFSCLKDNVELTVDLTYEQIAERNYFSVKTLCPICNTEMYQVIQ